MWRASATPNSVLEVSGTPYEQGFQQGQACGDAIGVNLAQIKRLVAELIGSREDWYRELLGKNEAYLERLDPGTLEELAGLASGSGIELYDLLLMNLPVYMLLRRARIIEECSVFAVSAQATEDGHSYLGKTRDQPIDQFQFEHVVLSRSYPSGQRIVEVNAAGIITNPGNGLNDAGLAVGTAGAWSRQRLEVKLSSIGQAHCMPDMHYLLRNAADVPSACEMLQSLPRLAGMNLILADRGGRQGTVEVTPTGLHFTPAEDGVSCITNHYITEEIRHLTGSVSENPASFARREFILQFLGDRRGRVGFFDLIQLSMDHSNGPQNSVCRHPIESMDSITRYVSIAAVDKFELWTHLGHPCGMGVATAAVPRAVPPTYRLPA